MTSPTRVHPFHDQSAVEAFLKTRKEGLAAYGILRKALFREGRSWPSALALLPQGVANELERHFAWHTLLLKSTVVAGDGSTKALWEATDGKRFESVLIRNAAGRATLCVSTQVGCAMGCVFCSTGQLGLARDLTAAEILEQASWAVDLLRTEGKRLRNVVFMGMGEPLLNRSALGEALRALMDQRRFEIAPRHVTVSTCGVVGALVPWAREFPLVRLAVSLHAARQDLRDQLMPGCRGWPLARLMNELDEVESINGQKLFFEYIMISGVNDGAQELEELGKLLAGRTCHVNLIPYNPGVGDERRASSREVLDHFQRGLKAAGIRSTVRQSSGDAIAAACGQLAATSSCS